MKHIHTLLLAFAFTLSLSAQNVASNSATGSNYTNVQEAIDASISNYTIYLFSNITNGLVVSGKTNLTITKSNGLSVNPVVSGNGSGNGIYITNSLNIYVSCIDVWNWGRGIYVSKSSGNTFSSNTIYSNRWAGIFLIDSTCSNNIIANNMFWGGEDESIYIYGGKNNNVKSNIISNYSSIGTGIATECGSLCSNYLSYNNIKRSRTGIYNYGGYLYGAYNNIKTIDKTLVVFDGSSPAICNFPSNYYYARAWSNNNIENYSTITNADPWVNSFMNFNGDWTPPLRPLSVNLSNDSLGNIVVRWMGFVEADFSNCQIFRTTNDSYSNLTDGDIVGRTYENTSSGIYTDTPPQSGVNYYYFLTSVDTNGNESWYSPKINPTNVPNISAKLSIAQVTPLIGSTNTNFTFSVQYSDYDNDAPATGVYIVISNLGAQPVTNTMTTTNTSYTNAYYTFATNLSVITNYSFYCFTSSLNTPGTTNRTAVVSAPSVTMGRITNIYVSPSNGYSSNSYTFTAIYYGADIDSPLAGFPKLVLSNTNGNMITNTMTSNSGSPSTGTVYRFTTNMLSMGSYSYHAFVSSSLYTTSTNYSSTNTGLLVSNAPPSFSLSSSPVSGSTNTVFTFTVGYNDVEGDGPTNGVFIVVSNAASFCATNSMIYSNGGFSSGAVYTFATNYTNAGNYSFYVFATGSNNTVISVSTNATGPVVVTNFAVPEIRYFIAKGSAGTPLPVTVQCAFYQSNFLPVDIISLEYRDAGNSNYISVPLGGVSGKVSNIQYSDGIQTLTFIIASNISAAKKYFVRMRAVSLSLPSDYAETVITFTGTSSASANAYPNPSRNGVVTFFGVPSDAKILIYNVGGEFIRELKNDALTEDGRAGRVIWQTDNKAGKLVAPGVYLCVVQSDGMQKTIRIMILR
ncbi:MAG: right-handed parallel beta-helix repeat-containing protein [Candidatus Omnitrophica bacterium]|nr:right-handed parallel beta-helix repeat-containing protein [Candidatus Omnitrophota bacterium]